MYDNNLLKQDYKRSRFAHLLENEGTFCLYNSLTMKKIYGNEILKDIFNYFKTISVPYHFYTSQLTNNPDLLSDFESLISKLVEKGILVSSSNEDSELLSKRKQKALSIKNISLMYLIPTSNCNYNCSYCFVENKIDNHSIMNKDTCLKGIEYFASQTHNSKSAKVTFYGGEPLLNENVVYEGIRHIRRLENKGIFKIPVKVTLITNGSLVNENTAKVCNEHNVNISVSIDGPEAIHNKSRIFLGGGGTFEQSVKGFKLLQAESLMPSVSCTLSNHNINHFEELLSFIIDDLKSPSLGFNILLPKFNESHADEPEAELATHKIIEAFKLLRTLGIYEDRMMRRVKPFCKDVFHYKDCYGVGGQIVLTPDGRMGPCQAYLGLNDHFPVSLDNPPEDINYHSMFSMWIKRFPLNNEECLSCRALAICGGGCPYAADISTGSIENIDRRICKQCQPIFDWLIWDLYEQLNISNGEVRHEQR